MRENCKVLGCQKLAWTFDCTWVSIPDDLVQGSAVRCYTIVGAVAMPSSYVDPGFSPLLRMLLRSLLFPGREFCRKRDCG